jgi:signal transduction histidine kinase
MSVSWHAGNKTMNSKTNKRILIVDDERLNVNILTHMLREEYTIMAAINGKQALKAATSELRPDLVLLDVMMPEMDGYEVCRQLKANPKTADIPVIFVTALGLEQNETQGFEAGAVDYITKPIIPAVVLARIRTHLALEDTLRDLKTQKKIVESRNSELDEMNQIKNKFIGMAAHDLRNPIVSILGFADVLRSEQDLNSHESQRYLNIISSACNKMLDLISDTLDVTVIESGELVLNLGIGSISDLITERMQIFEPIAAKKNIDIVWQYKHVENSWFDPNRVTQILDNLMSNAIKFSPQGTRVNISLNESEDFLKISIKDEGPGISTEDQSRIFNHFEKAKNKPTDGETSTGLGLAIARRIVEVHHGSLMVESEAGNGATFSFTLPRHKIPD